MTMIIVAVVICIAIVIVFFMNREKDIYESDDDDEAEPNLFVQQQQQPRLLKKSVLSRSRQHQPPPPPPPQHQHQHQHQPQPQPQIELGPIGPCVNATSNCSNVVVATQCALNTDMLMDQFQTEVSSENAVQEADELQTKLKEYAENNPQLQVNKILIPIFVINLKRRPDRLQRIVRQFEIYGIENFHIVDAIDVNKLHEYKYKSDSINMRPNEVACALSHIKATKTYIEKAPNSPHVLILEDDVDLDLCVLWKKSLPEIIKDAPSFDILNVNSYCANNVTGKYVYELETKYKRCLSAGAYVISFDAAKLFVEESFIGQDTYYLSGCRRINRDSNGACRPGTEFLMTQADLRLYELVDRCYSINPPMFTQFTDVSVRYSDVQSNSMFQLSAMTIPIIRRYFERKYV